MYVWKCLAVSIQDEPESYAKIQQTQQMADSLDGVNEKDFKS